MGGPFNPPLTLRGFGLPAEDSFARRHGSFVVNYLMHHQINGDLEASPAYFYEEACVVLADRLIGINKTRGRFVYPPIPWRPCGWDELAMLR